MVTPEYSLNRNLIAFSESIEPLESAGQRIVLCLDEFENTFKHRGHFTEDFFDHMRSQFNMPKLAFVTGTQHPLQDLSLEGRLTSPFYNVFTGSPLEEFTKDEAYHFVVTQGDKVNFTYNELGFVFSYL